MSAKSRLAEVLSALADALESEGIRWYVFGAQAVVAYGNPRLTTDIDVTAELPLENAGSLVDSLLEHGFEPRTKKLESVVMRTRVLPMVHRASSYPVDIVIAGPGLETKFLENAGEVDLAGVKVPMISPSDLIVTKILAGRAKDLTDVEGILRERGPEVDLERAVHLLGLLETALDRSDLCSELQRIVTRVDPDGRWPTKRHGETEL